MIVVMAARFNQAEISFSGVDFLTCVFHEYQRRVSLSFSDIITGHATSGVEDVLRLFGHLVQR